MAWFVLKYCLPIWFHVKRSTSQKVYKSKRTQVKRSINQKVPNQKGYKSKGPQSKGLQISNVRDKSK